MNPTTVCHSCKTAFFSSSDPLFYRYEDHRSLPQKITDKTRAIFNEIHFALRALRPLFLWKKGLWHNDVYCLYKNGAFSNLPWRKAQESKGLQVFVTGLFGNPVGWNSYICDVKKENKGTHLLVPEIPNGGNCCLEDAARPILQPILDYHKKFPQAPISLIGFSNGGRIVGWLEKQPELKDAKIQVISIAGAHYGSSLEKIFPKKYFDWKNIHQALRNELGFESSIGKTILETWKTQGLAQERIFYASTEDTRLFQPAYSLPIIGQYDHHNLVHAQSHLSILSAVQDEVLRQSRDFIQRNI